MNGRCSVQMSIQFTYSKHNEAGAAADYDVVIAFVSKDELKQAAAGAGQGDPAAWIHPQLDDSMRQHAAKELFKADAKETLVLPTLGLYGSAHVIYVGIASQESLTTDGLRDAAAAAAKASKRLKAVAVKQLLP